MANPSIGLQSLVIALLGAGFYFILRLRYRQPVLKPLGWVVPQRPYIVMALMVGPSFAAGIALYLRLCNQVPPTIQPEFRFRSLSINFHQLLAQRKNAIRIRPTVKLQPEDRR